MTPADTSFTAMTPQSFKDEFEREDSQALSTQGSDKKPTKKRKSWGQELPTPKTNLPPRYDLDDTITSSVPVANAFNRKRAKTEDEKEQRRIERVLRNRAAAHSSRERKRKEYEGLEDQKRAIMDENAAIKARLEAVEMENRRLQEELRKMTVFQGTPAQPSTTVEPISSSSPSLTTTQASPSVISLKQELDELELPSPPPLPTVDPRQPSFSTSSPSSENGSTAAVPSDMTQHPAEMLCDLQCQSEHTEPCPPFSEWTSTQAAMPSNPKLTQVLFLTMVSTTYSHLMAPLAAIFYSLRWGSPLSLANQPTTIFSLIHWLITKPSRRSKTAATPSPSTATSPPRSSMPTPPTFRFPLLQRLLACSPALARPLRDATAEALQQLSSGEAGPIVGSVCADGSLDHGRARMERWSSLVTMLWAIDSIQRSSGVSPQSTVSESEDPVGDIRRTCLALDEYLGHSALGGVRALEAGTEQHPAERRLSFSPFVLAEKMWE